ncbi:MAG: hypothetical protein JNM56_32075, partial [Planctomycetia bacterium]|nr:hypothetical protein [Planctomycetia bacterium]
AAAQDEERRAQRQAESALRADDRDRWQVGLGAVADFDVLLRQLTHAVYLAAGYAQPPRP